MAIPGDILLSENEINVIKGQELVIGAIELAYKQMDQMVEQQAQRGGGGCTSLTVLFLNGLLYAAGAGDSRQVVNSMINFQIKFEIKKNSNIFFLERF